MFFITTKKLTTNLNIILIKHRKHKQITDIPEHCRNPECFISQYQLVQLKTKYTVILKILKNYDSNFYQGDIPLVNC